MGMEVLLMAVYGWGRWRFHLPLTLFNLPLPLSVNREGDGYPRIWLKRFPSPFMERGKGVRWCHHPSFCHATGYGVRLGSPHTTVPGKFV